jgi:hypothetical protein
MFNSLTIKEMKIKMTLRFHLTEVRMIIIKKAAINSSDNSGKRIFILVGGNVN